MDGRRSGEATTPSQGYVPTTTYEYLDNRYRPYLITTVTNKPSPEPTTWSTTTWTYDVKKRVTSAERSINKERWLYSYDDAKQQVKVTDGSGQTTIYSKTVGIDGITRLAPVSLSSSAKPSSSFLNRLQELSNPKQACSLEKDCHAYCTDKCVGVGLGSDAPFCYWKCMRECESW